MVMPGRAQWADDHTDAHLRAKKSIELAMEQIGPAVVEFQHLQEFGYPMVMSGRVLSNLIVPLIKPGLGLSHFAASTLTFQ